MVSELTCINNSVMALVDKLSFVCFVNVLFMIKWINSSYVHGLLFGGNRVRKYQHVFSSAEFFVDENYGHTVSPECADLLQTNCGV